MRGQVVVVVVALLAGCGDVHVTGTLGERVLRCTGTVAVWLDATSFQDQGDGSFERVERVTDATELHLEFFEPVFDPAVDFGALPAGERTALVDDISRGDQLSITVRRGEALRPGDDIASLPEQGLPPEVLPFVTSTLITLRERAVDETAPSLAGTITIEVEADDDEDAALEGKLAIEFNAELLPERIGECNFDRFGQGDVDACTLVGVEAPVADAGGG